MSHTICHDVTNTVSHRCPEPDQNQTLVTAGFWGSVVKESIHLTVTYPTAWMLDDPDCTGDLFGLGVALLDFAVLRINRDERSWQHYADQVFEHRSRWAIREVLRKDIRRYDAIKDAEGSAPYRKCGAPMIRRQGPCGQSAGRQAMLTDTLTGRKQWIAGCKRHEDWFNAQVRANRAQVDEITDAVRPPANTGGVLARHIPEIDWEAAWVKLDPSWTKPPEAEPEVVEVYPKLRLVLGDAG